jgi:CIC family chloride channel protein
MKNNILNNGIPVSVSLNPTLESENFKPQRKQDKKRLLFISFLAVSIAIVVSFIAKLLVYLIDFFTNISFFGNFSIEPSEPSNNALGIFVIIIPVIGGLIVGVMALYGSKAIRGHGIPEAMEQILTNQSKVKPSITYLKPLSAAISIGTGGPFGAEGPIIATGGAFGSTVGQFLKISDNERKILLAAGATAGMSAIFGSPIAAIFLAIELLLFEFSSRSFIPVALACITGAAGHHLLFKAGYVFEMQNTIEVPSNSALFIYSIMGIVIGLCSVLVTKIVYWIEDLFERTPIHWALWPAIGGLGVGIAGYFSPRTLGVGYYNITDLLSGNMSLQIVLSLCVLKFISWAISLGSGTSGGTLAPLLTIGSATGALFAILIMQWFPASGITIPLAALIGMAAMFAGASRAFLTSIIFALETTGQAHALVPLLAACSASYFVSFFLMENSIMTEKIIRRGVKTPDSFVPDILEKISVRQILSDDHTIISEENSIEEIRAWLETEEDLTTNYFVISNNNGEYKGILSSLNLLNSNHDIKSPVGSLIKYKQIHISPEKNLKTAIELMAKENIDVLPVISENNKQLAGILSYKDILSVYKNQSNEHEEKQPHLSLKRNTIKIILRGKKIVSSFTSAKD